MLVQIDLGHMSPTAPLNPPLTRDHPTFLRDTEFLTALLLSCPSDNWSQTQLAHISSFWAARCCHLLTSTFHILQHEKGCDSEKLTLYLDFNIPLPYFTLLFSSPLLFLLFSVTVICNGLVMLKARSYFGTRVDIIGIRIGPWVLVLIKKCSFVCNYKAINRGNSWSQIVPWVCELCEMWNFPKEV